MLMHIMTSLTSSLSKTTIKWLFLSMIYNRDVIKCTNIIHFLVSILNINFNYSATMQDVNEDWRGY